MGSRARAVRKSHKRTCQVKIGYPSKDAAVVALRHLGKNDRGTLKVYRCSRCRKYHLGNAPGSRFRSRLDAIQNDR